MRRMAQASFRREQEAGRYAAHVRRVNELVDDLADAGRGWLPHIAPAHGGVDARLLTVLRDPGPKTRTGSGSGFLCVENDDPTAEAQLELIAEAGVEIGEITPWNDYPWYINTKPTATQLKAGVEPLRRLVALLPQLTVVLLQGGEAQSVWKRLVKRHPELDKQPWTVIPTYHPGRGALRDPDPAVRARRIAHRHAAWLDAGAALHPAGPPWPSPRVPALVGDLRRSPGSAPQSAGAARPS